jgi:thioredoxin reductase
LNACGNDIIEPLLNKIKRLPNVELHLNTAFKNFIVREEDGGVEGIRLENNIDEQPEMLPVKVSFWHPEALVVTSTFAPSRVPPLMKRS